MKGLLLHLFCQLDKIIFKKNSSVKEMKNLYKEEHLKVLLLQGMDLQKNLKLEEMKAIYSETIQQITKVDRIRLMDVRKFIKNKMKISPRHEYHKQL